MDSPGINSLDAKDLEANRLTKSRISSREVSISIPVDTATGFDPTYGWYPIGSTSQFREQFDASAKLLRLKPYLPRGTRAKKVRKLIEDFAEAIPSITHVLFVAFTLFISFNQRKAVSEVSNFNEVFTDQCSGVADKILREDYTGSLA